ncbi:MAG: hypothetical protein GY720_03030 [bacterium]|nr:hypothetical protein [bacterium]MCP5065851.1 hypothetical protein [bacterium]
MDHLVRHIELVLQADWGGAELPVDAAKVLAVSSLYLVSTFWAIVAAWKRFPGWMRPLVWSVVGMVPFIGPLFFAAFSKPPPPQHRSLRGRRNRAAETYYIGR